MIANIQLLRGLAALGVAFYHAGYVIPGAIHSDFLGVPVFFVISGFIMTLITRETGHGFLLHRLIRIVPLYWIFSTIYAALVVFIYPLMGKHSIDVVTLASFLKDLFFVPRFDDAGELVFPVLAVGWTLNLEMFFYLLFAIGLLVSRRLAPLMVAAVVAIYWFFGRSLPGPFVFYAHQYVVYFPMGIAIYYAAKLSGNGAAATGAVAVFVGAAGLIYFSATGSQAASLIAAPLIVFGAVSLERAGFACRNCVAVALGSCSYALYLCHSFFTGAFREAAKRVVSLDATAHLPAALLAVAAGTGAAWLVFIWVERPLLIALRSAAEGVGALTRRSNPHGASSTQMLSMQDSEPSGLKRP